MGATPSRVRIPPSPPYNNCVVAHKPSSIYNTFIMRSVVICGSKKYKKKIDEFSKNLIHLGAVVFEPNFEEVILEDDFFKSKHVTKSVFKGLTLEHFDWIRKADVCFILGKN